MSVIKKINIKHHKDFNLDFDLISELLSHKISKCPICKCNDFMLDDNLTLLENTNIDNYIYHQYALPLVMLVCKNCGHTMFFNAKVLKNLSENKDVSKRNNTAQENLDLLNNILKHGKTQKEK